ARASTSLLTIWWASSGSRRTCTARQVTKATPPTTIATKKSTSAWLHARTGAVPVSLSAAGCQSQPSSSPSRPAPTSAPGPSGARWPGEGSGGPGSDPGWGPGSGPGWVIACSEQLEREVLTPAHAGQVDLLEQLGDRPVVQQDGVGLEVVPRLEHE